MKKIKKQMPSQLLCNQKGSLTIQFIFSFMLVFGFIFGFFYLSLTLVVGELVQYATYSSSRYLSLSNETVIRQKNVSQLRYRGLLFAPAGSGGIFKAGFFGSIDADKPFNLESLPNQGVNSALPPMQLGDRNLSYGVWTRFQPKGLSLKIPFWGDSEQGAQQGWSNSVIGSYLGREPSQKECTDFAKDRWQMIKDKINSSSHRLSPPGGFSGSGNSPNYGSVEGSRYDNGC